MFWKSHHISSNRHDKYLVKISKPKDYSGYNEILKFILLMINSINFYIFSARFDIISFNFVFLIKILRMICEFLFEIYEIQWFFVGNQIPKNKPIRRNLFIFYWKFSNFKMCKLNFAKNRFLVQFAMCTIFFNVFRISDYHMYQKV